MSTTPKILLLLLPLGIILLIAAVQQSWNDSGYADNMEEENVAPHEPQIIRHQRAIWPAIIHYCKINQYYDYDEGRCLGVPGGGKVLHIENRRSCGLNVLKPHCRSSLYYHICKRDKSLLAQCASRQIFDSRLQRCVYYESNRLAPNVILPDSFMYYDHVNVPSCTRAGRFPVPGHCSMFYTCDTNGHRLYQSVFRCPQNTGYEMDRGVCNVVSGCVNDNSVDTTVCVPNAPGENVAFPSLVEAAEGNVKGNSEILEQSTSSAGPIVEREEVVNSKTYDDDVVVPVSTIGTSPEINYNNNNGDTEVPSSSVSSSNPVEEDLVPDGIDERITHSQTPILPEIVQKVSDEGQNGEDKSSSSLGLKITSPAEFNDAPHSVTTSVTSIEPEYRMSNTDVNSEITDTASFPSDSYLLTKLGKGIQGVTTDNVEDGAATLSNFNTKASDSYPSTISNAPEIAEIPPISDVPSKIDDELQDAVTQQYENNEGSAAMPSNFNTDSSDLYSAPIMSDVPVSFPTSNMSPNLDAQLQDIGTEYKNNEGSVLTPSNFDTDSVDLYSAPTVSNIPESFSISNLSPKIDAKLQDAATEQNKNVEASILIPSNFNRDLVDLNPASTVSNVPESSLISDVPSKINEDVAAEQYENNEDSAVIPSNFNTDSVESNPVPAINNLPESSLISELPSTINEKTQNVATEQYGNNEDSAIIPSNFNTDSIELNPIPAINNLSESSLISELPSTINEKTQNAATEQYENNEDSAAIPPSFNADSINLDLEPTVSSVSESPISELPTINEEMKDAAVEQYKNNEDSVVTPSNFNTDSVDLYPTSTLISAPESSLISDVPSTINKEMQNAAMEQYENNEDSAMMPSSYNTDSINLDPAPVSNLPESSPISELPSTINEKMQNAPTEQYENNEDSAVMPSSYNTDSINLDPEPTISSVSESPISELPTINQEMQDTAMEQYKNKEDSAVTSSNFNTDSVDMDPTSTLSSAPESSLISDVPLTINKEMQNAATEQYENNEDSAVMPSSFNADSINLDPEPTISNVPESPISELPTINKEMEDAVTEQYKSNEDGAVTSSNFNADSINLNLAPTVSNLQEPSSISELPSTINKEMQDATVEQYKNNEDSVVTPSNFNTDSVNLYSGSTVTDAPESFPISEVTPNIDEKIQDTEQYMNNEDSASNFNTDSVNLYPTQSSISESSPITDTSSKFDEKIQNITPEINRKDDEAVTLSNASTEIVDPNLTSVLNDAPVITDSSRNDDSDVLSSTSAPVILPQAADDEPTTEELSEAIPSVDSKFADTSFSTSDGLESVSTQNLPENTDDLTPTTRSTLISRDTPMDIAAIPSIQDPPISDTDLVMENDKDSTEASPASFTE